MTFAVDNDMLSLMTHNHALVETEDGLLSSRVADLFARDYRFRGKRCHEGQ